MALQVKGLTVPAVEKHDNTLQVKGMTVPAVEKHDNTLQVKGMTVPAFEVYPNDLQVKGFTIPLMPLKFQSIQIIDSIGNLTIISVSNARLVDVNTALPNFDDLPLTFQAGSLVADEANFVFGWSLSNIEFIADVAVRFTSGRNALLAGQKLPLLHI